MKRLNKKGFTLIELLAVIIILGVLMIIAIPAVTKYINDSRKSAYVDSGVHYVDAVSKEAIAGKDLKMYNQSTLYLVAVGHDKTKSCITLESGGKSPYSDTWDFAYVGVTASNNGYDYYFIARDNSGKKMPFTANKNLVDNGTTLFDGEINAGVVTNLTNQYTSGENAILTSEEDLATYSTLTEVVGKTISKIVIVNKPSNGGCTYSDN